MRTVATPIKWETSNGIYLPTSRMILPFSLHRTGMVILRIQLGWGFSYPMSEKSLERIEGHVGKWDKKKEYIEISWDIYQSINSHSTSASSKRRSMPWGTSPMAVGFRSREVYSPELVVSKRDARGPLFFNGNCGAIWAQLRPTRCFTGSITRPGKRLHNYGNISIL